MVLATKVLLKWTGLDFLPGEPKANEEIQLLSLMLEAATFVHNLALEVSGRHTGHDWYLAMAFHHVEEESGR